MNARPITELRWRPASATPALSGHRLHLWRLRLTLGDAASDSHDLDLLSPRQRERWGRLRQATHRRRFFRAQARCRRILGSYIDVAPEKLRFRYGAAGKPALDCGSASQPQFNLTTTGDLALLAVSAIEPVGVDCELERARTDLLGVARRMFTAEELQDLTELTGNARVRAFHLCWTALEAGVKVDGRGLARHREPSPAGVSVAHGLAGSIDGQAAVCAVARRNLPPVDEWLALDFEPDLGRRQIS
ncbi:MAG: 4'-phosphopantetheinyl transferase superfamily protein [Thiohalocapsa sp.]